jgi:hypothetical protein
VIARLSEGSTLIDLRSVDPADDMLLTHALNAIP